VVSPEASGFELSVEMLLMVVLGGLGTVWGALTGAVTVQLLDEGSRDLIRAIIPGAGGEVQLIAFGVVLVLVIILVPGGLAQLWRLLVDRFRPAAGSIGRNDTPEASETVPIDGSVRPVGPDGVATLLAEADLPQRGTPLLVVSGLTKRYGGVTALSHLDLEVRAGEILALIGPNGAGKTTAFNMISSVLPPTDGTVTFRGTEVQGRRPHEATSRSPATCAAGPASSAACSASRSRRSVASSRPPARHSRPWASRSMRGAR
jgi:branched-chain amino acid transport system permease protein